MATKMMTRRQVSAEPAIDEARTRIYYWWLLLAVFVEYVRPGAFIPAFDAIKAGTIIPGALLAATLVAPGLRPWRHIFSDRYVKWLVVYLALIACSVPLAEVTLYAYETLATVTTHFTLFAMIARICTSTTRLRGLVAALVSAHMTLFALNPALVLSPETRAYIQGAPFLGDGNDFGLSLCILMPLTIEIALHTRSKVSRTLAWASAAAILLAILGTQSRGASLAMATVFVFLWLQSKAKLKTAVAMLLVSLFVLAYASDTYFYRMSTIAHYEGEGSAEARIRAWKSGVKMASDHPMTGVGAGQFPMAYGRAIRAEGGGRWMTAHSMYFLILGELGLPGIVTLLALVLGSPLALLALRRRVLAATHGPPVEWRQEADRFLCMLAAGCIGFAVAGAFLSVAYYPHLFVLTAVTASARLIVKARLDDPPPTGSPKAAAASRFSRLRPSAKPGQPHDARSRHQ